MKKLFCCVISLLCISMLTLPAMADVLPPRGSGVGVTLILAVAAVIIAVIYAIIRNRKK